MPAKSVFQYDCSRCKRTWYEKEEKKVANIAINMECSDGTKVTGAFETLCNTCENTVKGYIESILKNLQKVSSSKPRAKKEGPEPPSTPTKAPTLQGSSQENTPRAVATPPPLSPSRRQSAH